MSVTGLLTIQYMNKHTRLESGICPSSGIISHGGIASVAYRGLPLFVYLPGSD